MTIDNKNVAPKERMVDKRWDAQFAEWFKEAERISLDTLLRVDNPEYNFQELRPQLKTFIDTLGELSENFDFWESLPVRKRQDITNTLKRLFSSIDEILGFDAKQNSAWQQRANVISNFLSYYTDIHSLLIEKLQAYLGMVAYSQDLTSNFSQQAKEQLDEISAAKSRIYEMQKSIEDVASIVSDTTSTATSNFFENTSTTHNRAAHNWLFGVIFSMGGFVVVTFIIIRDIALTTPTYDTAYISTLSIKAAVIAALFLAVRFTTKNYNANKHIAVINKHRANVLSTIEAFRQAAYSEATKDAILAGGVAAAFGQSESGYISTKEGAGSSDGDVKEILSLFKSSKP